MGDDRVDCVGCGPTLSDGDLQRVAFDVVDIRDTVPLFDTSGDAEDGTGYGLAIVTDIVDGHGWTIRGATAEPVVRGSR